MVAHPPIQELEDNVLSMFKKSKPMFKKLEISPKDLDKPLLN